MAILRILTRWISKILKPDVVLFGEIGSAIFN